MPPHCPNICPREQVQVDPESAGVVDAVETICRGAFEDNYNKKREIKPNLIPQKRLLEGQLSVYRASDKAQFTIAEVAEQLRITRTPPVEPTEIYCATAAQIRDLRVEWLQQRLFCLIDECVIDLLGNKHRAHAHLVICVNVVGGLNEPDLIGVRDRLYLLFKQSIGWARAA